MSSGYRDFKEQSKLYKEMGSDYALPAGYSEHNLGLSLDVGSTQKKMEKAPEGKWVAENVWKHGFVLRYPKIKVILQAFNMNRGIYVMSAYLIVRLCKKENYTRGILRLLKREKEITTDVEGKKYTVSYYKVSGNMKVSVPANKQYEISGNNMDGVIVTVQE